MRRFRHRCSSRYLRISPLHREFHAPLPYSSTAVSPAGSELSPEISLVTYRAAYAPFTPNNSEQRLPPSYYRGCWHEVSRGFFHRYRHNRPGRKEFTSQGTSSSTRRCCVRVSPHCAKFPTAASRRSLDRVSVPVCPCALSGRIPIIALVGHYPANKLISRDSLFKRIAPLIPRSSDPRMLCGISPGFPELSPTRR